MMTTVPIQLVEGEVTASFNWLNSDMIELMVHCTIKLFLDIDIKLVKILRNPSPLREKYDDYGTDLVGGRRGDGVIHRSIG